MNSVDAYPRQIGESGFAVVRNIVSSATIEALVGALDQLQQASVSRRGKEYAARNLLDIPQVSLLANSLELRSLVEPVLGSEARAVRGILFDKIPGANWHVGWHQDQIIPVAESKEVLGFTAWTVKQGVPHVRAPAIVLERMLTLRIHLDECGSKNGALRVISGSHTKGLLDDDAI